MDALVEMICTNKLHVTAFHTVRTLHPDLHAVLQISTTRIY